MKKNFWHSLPKPFTILAPMEDVTDIVFRQVIAHTKAPDVYFTEFTNSESFCHEKGRESVRGRLAFLPKEQPIVAHIWGDKPEHFKEMSSALNKMGFSGIDLNMGCPVDNVVRHGRGAGLILRPEVVSSLIEAAKEGGLPVSVKTRLGFYDIYEYKDWLAHLLNQDIANLSIHLRTKVEMSDVPAHYELIDEIKELRDQIAPGTLLTINGDIPDVRVGKKLIETTGVDGFMIGRGVFKNPFAFDDDKKENSPQELLELFRVHLDLYDKYQSVTQRPFVMLRRFFKIYVREFEGAHQLRIQLMETNSTDEVRQLLDEVKL